MVFRFVLLSQALQLLRDCLTAAFPQVRIVPDHLQIYLEMLVLRTISQSNKLMIHEYLLWLHFMSSFQGPLCTFLDPDSSTLACQ